MKRRVKKNKRELDKAYGVDEWGFPDLPTKVSGVRISRLTVGGSMGCPWYFPHGNYTYNHRRGGKCWKDYRSHQWKEKGEGKMAKCNKRRINKGGVSPYPSQGSSETVTLSMGETESKAEALINNEKSNEVVLNEQGLHIHECTELAFSILGQEASTDDLMDMTHIFYKISKEKVATLRSLVARRKTSYSQNIQEFQEYLDSLRKEVEGVPKTTS